ncbi:LuxR C-terminal-related transcriptional regulator [Janibacter sp. GXQ6167]|uniref:helix-turn-helix transcriptional regulator n=1 Tax=Janibacter sp. GXQ6167 TaxID=3240791 RepID=UPI003526A052
MPHHDEVDFDGADGTAKDAACQQVLAAVGVSEAAREAYLARRHDPSVRIDPVLFDELVETGFLAPRTGHLLPLRVAVATWSAQRAAETAVILDAAEVAGDVTDRRGDAPFLELVSGLSKVVSTFAALQGSSRALIRAFDRPPYLTVGGPTLATEQPDTADRGVQYRTIYLAANVHDEQTRQIVAQSIELGEEARVAHDLPMRMIIADDDRAMLILPQPATTPDEVDQIEAVVIYRSALLDALIRLFETTWAQSLPIDGLASTPKTSEVDRRVLAMLSSGMTDARIAAALGVSERTVARRVAAMQERLDAPSRFVLGVRAAHEGLA